MNKAIEAYNRYKRGELTFEEYAKEYRDFVNAQKLIKKACRRARNRG